MRPSAGPPRTALVLSGGGARGAYQVGVLRGLVEQGFLPRNRARIDVLVGLERGIDQRARRSPPTPTISTTGLAAARARLGRASDPAQVFRTDVALARPHRRALGLGPLVRRRHASRCSRSRCSTPRRCATLLAEHIPFERIDANVAPRRARAPWRSSPPTSTPRTASSSSHAAPETPAWTRRRWRIERTRDPRRAPDGVERDPDLLPVGRDRRAPLRRRLDPQHGAAEPGDQPRRRPDHRDRRERAAAGRRRPRARSSRRRSRRSRACCSTR